jgi:hypothetical protein
LPDEYDLPAPELNAFQPALEEPKPRKVNVRLLSNVRRDLGFLNNYLAVEPSWDCEAYAPAL